MNPIMEEEPSSGGILDDKASAKDRDEAGEAQAFGAKSLVVDFLCTTVEGSTEVESIFKSMFGVHEVIDGPGLSTLMREAKAREEIAQGEPSFRWIHLPANNMAWVEVSFPSLCLIPFLNRPSYL